MKKLIAILLLVTLVLSMAACGSDKKSDSGDFFGNSGNFSNSNAKDTAAGTGANCKECGKTIAANRKYCDPCLYGTCLGCGKKLDWTDRELYCSICGNDTAAGTGANCKECGKTIAADRKYCDPCLYGTCLKCGKKLNWTDRKLYCSTCE